MNTIQTKQNEESDYEETSEHKKLIVLVANFIQATGRFKQGEEAKRAEEHCRVQERGNKNGGRNGDRREGGAGGRV